MIRARWNRLSEILMLGASCMALLAASCPTEAGPQYVVTVHATGSGVGVVTSATGAMNCEVSAGTTQGICVEPHTNDPHSPVVRLAFVAAPAPGSTFEGWRDQADGEPNHCINPALARCEVDVEQAHLVTETIIIRAHFASAAGDVELSVDLSAADSGITVFDWNATTSDGQINCPNTLRICRAWYAVGSTASLHLVQHGGGTFGRWEGCVPIWGPVEDCMVVMDSARAVKGHPATGVRWEIVVSAAGNGTGRIMSNPVNFSCDVVAGATTPGICAGSWAGPYLYLLATAAPGSGFTGWSGSSCGGTDSCIVFPTGQTMQVTATFSLLPSIVQLTLQGAGAGDGAIMSSPAGIACTSTAGLTSGSCSASFPSGTVVTLTSTAAAGSTDGGLLGGGCRDLGSCTLTLDSAVTVTAAFSPTMHRLTVAGGGTHNGHVAASPGTMSCGIFSGGILHPMDCLGEFLPGTIVTLTATPGLNARFTGWSGGGCSGTGTCAVTMDSAITVTASFGPSAHILTIAGGGTHNGHVASSPGTMSCGIFSGGALHPMDCIGQFGHGTTVTLTATPGLNARFTGWSGGGCSGTGTCAVTMDSAITVTASFGPSAHVLTVMGGGTHNGHVASSPGTMSCGIFSGGALHPMDCIGQFGHGTSVTLTATPGLNALFTGWSGGGCSGTATTCVVTMDSAITVTASFGPSTHTLTVMGGGTHFGHVASSPGSMRCPTGIGNNPFDCTRQFAVGTIVTLTATPGANAIFAGWSGGGCSGTGTCVVTMDSTMTVTATFNALTMFTLSVSFTGGTGGTGSVTSVPAGINCSNSGSGGGSVCSASFQAGTAVTLTATPSGSFTFTGWSGAGCSGTGTCVVTMNGDESVVASFGVPTFPITVTGTGTGSGSGSGTVTSSAGGMNCTIIGGFTSGTCTINLQGNTVVFLFATPAAGSTFLGWGGSGCSGTGMCVVFADAAKTITASFGP